MADPAPPTVYSLLGEVNKLYSIIETKYKLAIKTGSQPDIAATLENLIITRGDIIAKEAQAIELAKTGIYKDRLDPVSASGAHKFKYYLASLDDYMNTLCSKVKFDECTKTTAGSLSDFFTRLK